MNAKEAREKALSVNTGVNGKIYKEIKELIEKEVEDGGLNITYFDSISPTIVSALREEGYTLDYSSFRHENQWNISW